MTAHTNPSPGHQLTAAIAQFDNLVRATPNASAHDATPCPDYDITDLIDHVTIVIGRLVDALDASPTAPATEADWTSARDRARAAIARVDPSTAITLPFGTMPAYAAFGVLIGELTTHGWDLAAAIGRPDLLDQVLGAEAAASVTARIPEQPRDGMPFGPVVTVASDAPPYDRLAGWMGRDPAWPS